MEFSNKEKLAIINVACEMSLVDNESHPNEREYLIHLKQVLKLDVKMFEIGINYEKIEAQCILKEMDLNKKRTLVIILEQMIKSDGKITDEEAIFMHKLMQVLEIDINAINKI